MKPLIVINFKTYAESTGANAVRLATAASKVAADSGVTMIVVPQAADIYQVAHEVDIPVYAQHMDGIQFGGHTGIYWLKRSRRLEPAVLS